MKNVLSIQSHVVYGRAGNSAAVFPMLRAGVEVWPLNAVQFSNHTQYAAGWRGTVSSPGDLTDIVSGLVDIGVLGRCDAVLTGYIGSAGQGAAIMGIVKRVKSLNPKAWYFCDPVMGHPEKGCKVAPGVAEFHREHSVEVADMVSPNVLELGVIVGRELDSVEDCLDAARVVIERGPRMVLVKHLSYAARDPHNFEMILATRDEAWHVSRPMVEFARQPVGVGDLTSGLLLASLLKGMGFKDALEFTTAAVYEVMLATEAAGEYELALVAAQEYMMAPRRKFAAEKL